METTVTGSATTTSRRTIRLASVAVSVAGSHWSSIVEGVTASWVVHPVVLLAGLRCIAKGGGTLYLGITATIFPLVHVPWTGTACTGRASAPSRRHRRSPRRVGGHAAHSQSLDGLRRVRAWRHTRTAKSTQPPYGAERRL